MSFKELRELTGLSRAAFSREYHIPIRTIEDWESERRNPPEYVLELLEFKIRIILSQQNFWNENKYMEVIDGRKN